MQDLIVVPKEQVSFEKIKPWQFKILNMNVNSLVSLVLLGVIGSLDSLLWERAGPCT